MISSFQIIPIKHHNHHEGHRLHGALKTGYGHCSLDDLDCLCGLRYDISELGASNFDELLTNFAKY
jgi:hypothetical protein